MSDNQLFLEKSLKKLQHLKKRHKVAVFLCSNGDFLSSAIVLYRVAVKINDIIEKLKKKNSENKEYLKVIVKNKFPQFNSDLKILGEMADREEEDFSGQDKDQLLSIMDRTFGALIGIDKEVRSMYLVDPIWKEFFKSLSKKGLIIGVSIVLTLFLGFLGIKTYYKYHGLTGEYFKGNKLKKVYRVRQDPRIDFNWKTGGPFQNVRNNFSARWTGYIRIPNDGTYRFFTKSDDGVRLWVNNELIINNWTVHRIKDDKGKITVTEGSKPFMLEYFENHKNAIIQLYWQHGNMNRPQIIPSRYFTPSKKKKRR